KSRSKFRRLRAPNSLFIRENTRDFAVQRPIRATHALMPTLLQSVGRKFPTKDNSEFFEPNRECCAAYQGTLRLEQDGATGWGHPMEINASSQRFAASAPLQFPG